MFLPEPVPILIFIISNSPVGVAVLEISNYSKYKTGFQNLSLFENLSRSPLVRKSEIRKP